MNHLVDRSVIRQISQMHFKQLDELSSNQNAEFHATDFLGSVEKGGRGSFRKNGQK